jgi:hypothetical protein
MRFEECFALQLDKKSDRVPLVEYLRNHKKLAIVYIGVFLRQEINNTLRFIGLLRDTKSVISYTKLKSEKFANMIESRLQLPVALDTKVVYSHVDPNIIIVRIKKNVMLHDKPIKPIFPDLAEEEQSLSFMWGLTDEASKFAITINDVVIDKKYVAPCDIFAYNTHIKIFMDGEDRIKIFFRAIYKPQ